MQNKYDFDTLLVEVEAIDSFRRPLSSSTNRVGTHPRVNYYGCESSYIISFGGFDFSLEAIESVARAMPVVVCIHDLPVKIILHCTYTIIF